MLLKTPPVVRIDVALKFKRMWLGYIQSLKPQRVNEWNIHAFKTAYFHILRDDIEIISFKTMVKRAECQGFWPAIVAASDSENAAWATALSAQKEIDSVENKKGNVEGISVDDANKSQSRLTGIILGALRKINAQSGDVEGLFKRWYESITDERRAETLMKKACAAEGKPFADMVDGLLRGELGNEASVADLLEKKLHKYQTAGTTSTGDVPAGVPLSI